MNMTDKQHDRLDECIWFTEEQVSELVSMEQVRYIPTVLSWLYEFRG